MNRPSARIWSAVLVMTASIASGVGSQTAHADAANNAIASMSTSNLSITCSLSLDLTLPCTAHLVAPVGSVFPTDTTVFASLRQADATLATVNCQGIQTVTPPNPIRSFGCTARFINIFIPPDPIIPPNPIAPLSYALFVSGGGVSRSFCGTIGLFTINSNSCRISQ